MTTTMNIWKENLKKILETGYNYIDLDGRVAIETQNHKITIPNTAQKDIEKPIEKLQNHKEWHYPSKTEIANIMFKEIQNPVYDYTYGGRIFYYNKTLNQIEDYIIPLLTKEPNSRSAQIIIYDPLIDSKLEIRNKPGIISIYFRIINKQLTISAVIRSQDLFFGWPANIYQIHMIQKYVAKKLNLELGDITTYSNSTHIFKSNVLSILKIIQS